MRVLLSIFHIVLLLSISTNIVAQSRSKLEKERNAIIKKIDQTNKILKLTDKKSSNAIKNIDLINEKIKDRKSLIDNYEKSLKESTVKSKTLTSKKDSLSHQLNEAKSNYKKLLVVQFRKKKLQNKWLYVFSAESLSDALLRYRYYAQYNEYHNRQLQEIKETSEQYNLQIAGINQERYVQEKLIVSQKENQEKLKKQKERKNKYLKTLHKDKKKLKKALKKAKSKRENLNKAIENVILANLSKPINTSTKPINENKGSNRLSWPLKGSVITSKFGVHKHEELSGVKTSNNGIDLMSSSSESVKAALKGTVIAILKAPDNGTMVILQHGSYYTVYSNLIQVVISNDQLIKKGQKIGEIGKNKTLHFEYWHNKKKLNPQKYL